MSAWMISDNHARAIAQIDTLYGDGEYAPDDLTNLLLRECAESVNYRHPHADDRIAPEPVRYHPVITGDDPLV